MIRRPPVRSSPSPGIPAGRSFAFPNTSSPVAVSGGDSYAVVAAQKNTSLIGKIFSDLAEEQKRDPFDIAAELVIDEPDLYLSCGALSEDDMKEAMRNDWLSFSGEGGGAPT